MPKIHVHKPFRLQEPRGVWHDLKSGVHEVSEAVAAHWYTREHASLVGDDGQQPEAEEAAPVAEEAPATEDDASASEGGEDEGAQAVAETADPQPAAEETDAQAAAAPNVKGRGPL